ncbi:RICIN domain-containing protein, partial [Streptosporangium sp. NPDC001682]
VCAHRSPGAVASRTPCRLDGRLPAARPGTAQRGLLHPRLRPNGTPVHLWECANTNTNQKFVVDDGMIKVKDTLA